MEINLYIDDLRNPPEGFVVARTVEKAIDYYKENKVNILSLDHDMGCDENGKLLLTGYDFVKYFCTNSLHANKIYIHTDNVVGRINMYETLLGAQRRGIISESIEIFSYPIL